MIEDLSSRKHSVYVHCKAGKGRSATVVACYLLKVCKVKHQNCPSLSYMLTQYACTYIRMYISLHCMYFLAAAPILFSFGLPVCNARPIYIYIYNMDLKKSLIIENLYNSNREV